MAGLCLADIIWLGAAPTAFANIGWKYYLFFIIITAITIFTVYFTFPNTLNVPLEEVAKLFGDDDLVVSSASATTFEDDKPALAVEMLEHSDGEKGKDN